MPGKTVPRRSASQAPAPAGRGLRASSSAPPQLSAQAGPVMLSAPHGHELYRGGGDTGERERIHRREQWTTELVLRLAVRVDEVIAAKLRAHARPAAAVPPDEKDAAAPPTASTAAGPVFPPVSSTRGVTAAGYTFRRPPTGPAADKAVTPPPHCCSFVVWNSVAAKPLDRALKDPNYLRTTDFAASPWNQSLRDFQRHCVATFPAGTVPFHVDLHGKLNRKDDFDLDIGIESLHALWAPSSGPLAQRCALMQSVVAERFAEVVAACPVKHNGLEATIEMDPDLHGYWGNPAAGAAVTMTTQAALLGIHTMQLEIPHDMRRCLAAKRAAASVAFFDSLAVGIAGIFLDLQPAEVLPELALWYSQRATVVEHCGAARVAATNLLAATEKFFASSQMRHI